MESLEKVEKMYKRYLEKRSYEIIRRKAGSSIRMLCQNIKSMFTKIQQKLEIIIESVHENNVDIALMNETDLR